VRLVQRGEGEGWWMLVLPFDQLPIQKVKLPPSMKEFILEMTQLFGKVKLLLQRNGYYIESPDQEVIQLLLEDEVISKALIRDSVSNT